MDFSKFKNKYVLTGKLQVLNALHIGSGKESMDRDSPFISLDDNEEFYIPGSSFRGYLRTKLERFLDVTNNFKFKEKKSGEELNEADVNLIFGYTNLNKLKIENSDGTQNNERREKVQKRIAKKLGIEIKENEKILEKIESIRSLAGRIYIYDMPLLTKVSYVTRDGIKIDRNTGTTETGAKFDYDVVPMGTEFEFKIEMENVEKYQLELIGLALHDIKTENGDIFGGKTSRGIGKCRVVDLELEYIDVEDYDDKERGKTIENYIFYNKMKKGKISQIFKNNDEDRELEICL